MTTTQQRRIVKGGRPTKTQTKPGANKARMKPAFGRPIGSRTPVFLALFSVVAVLTALGVIMVLSASAASSINATDSAWSLFRRQLLWVGLGTIIMMVIMRIDYHRWKIMAAPLMVGSVMLLGFVLVPGVGLSANGATRWLGFGPITVQPSELAKFAVVLFVADLLSRSNRLAHDTRMTLMPVLIVVGFVLGLLVFQPHLGAILIIGTTVVVMLFLAGIPLQNLGWLTVAGAGLTSLMIFPVAWRRRRFFAFLDPAADPAGGGFQSLQSLHAITAGGWQGVGLGASHAKWGFLPFAHTDFIFAIIAEELGILGAFGVLTCFAIFGWAGMLAAVRAPDRFGMLLAAGITVWIMAQAILNIGAVIAVLPVTGVTLPFLSFGGSSVLVTLGVVGVLLNIARQGR